MSAAVYDIIIEQGATFNRTLTLKDSTGAAIDITGWVMRSMIRSNQSSSTPIIQFTCAILNQITYPGMATFSLTAAQTASIQTPRVSTIELQNGVFRYDVEIQRPDGFVIRLLQGKVSVVPEITKP
jgi:hypothetical protein